MDIIKTGSLTPSAHCQRVSLWKRIKSEKKIVTIFFFFVMTEMQK